MLSESEARQRILSTLSPLPGEMRPLLEAVGAFALDELRASVSLPGFDNSAMDGYALCFEGAEVAAGVRFSLCGQQAAGEDQGLTLRPGKAARVFTGAPVPAGTTAVAMQEDVRATPGAIALTEGVARGEFVRLAGSDLCRGQIFVRSGEALTIPRLSLLAAQGLSEVRIARPPRLAVFSTGDELVQPGHALRPGQIYDSNSTLLALLARGAGGQVTSVRHLSDDLAETTHALERAVDQADVLLLSGGVSVGERDFVKPALAAVGFEAELWKVALKPGKPFLFARHPRGALAFGLPGNPVSSYVTFQVLVAPALRRLRGAPADPALPLQRLRAAESLRNSDRRPHYLRGRVGPAGFEPIGRQESHALAGLAASTALARVPAETEIAAGEDVEVLSAQ
ncbi:MAG: molybdopterin molybdotransferase MoeA [Verrucomicrobia bacterium]|nr:molybdopterin molybdotransferase MoeA [Verrucomicrobiota bacterium]